MVADWQDAFESVRVTGSSAARRSSAAVSSHSLSLAGFSHSVQLHILVGVISRRMHGIHTNWKHTETLIYAEKGHTWPYQNDEKCWKIEYFNELVGLKIFEASLMNYFTVERIN